MDTLANDFVSLPIIITDYEPILKRRSTGAQTLRSPESPTAQQASDEDRRRRSSAPSSGGSKANWHTGFNGLADEIWNKLTLGMKAKVREACMEVLRRTDDPSETEKNAWLYRDGDEDARFLD
jgi:hypothetical protein